MLVLLAGVLGEGVVTLEDHPNLRHVTGSPPFMSQEQRQLEVGHFPAHLRFGGSEVGSSQQ